MSDVTAYISALPVWQAEVCERLRSLVHETVPGAEERIEYGKPHFLKNGQHAAVIHAAKAKVTFMVFNAAGVEPVKGLLRALGNGERKAVDITEGQDVDFAAVGAILAETSRSL